jgi:hypothetical protein
VSYAAVLARFGNIMKDWSKKDLVLFSRLVELKRVGSDNQDW